MVVQVIAQCRHVQRPSRCSQLRDGVIRHVLYREIIRASILVQRLSSVACMLQQRHLHALEIAQVIPGEQTIGDLN